MKIIIKNISVIIFCFFISYQNIYAQKIVTIDFDFENKIKFETPAKIDLDNITFPPDSLLTLIEISGDKRTATPFQINNGEPRLLHWIINNNVENGLNHVYELVKVDDKNSYSKMKIKKENGILSINDDDRELLGYQFKTVYPPAGIDTAYKRSGFIHPLLSPHGQVLTQIQPEDHYHHYGIWNPWTHVLYEADTVDFWNLAKREGTVRFANFVSTVEGPIFSEFKTLHQHVVFNYNGPEDIALNELQTVRIYKPENPDYYLVDINIELNCGTDNPVKLLKYRYGGLGWRATETWNSNNSEVLTSEGKIRKDADGSRARWIMVQGDIDNDHAGILIMSYPTNYNFPEPLRVWPEDQNERGDVFVNFSPTKNKDWELFPEKTYTLKYRLLVFNGELNGTDAENAWQSYTTENNIHLLK